MAGRAFKVTIPKSYNNVTEAKLVQKGGDVWVQLPANLVQNRRMSRRSVYMQDFNQNARTIPFRHRNAKAKVVTRHGAYSHPSEDFAGLHGHCMDLHTTSDVTRNSQGRKRMCRSLSSSFEGMSRGTHYGLVKSKHNEPIAAFLPTMANARSPELRMDHHYASPSMERSYNDKAREGLPGLGKWLESGDMHDAITLKHSGTIDGDDFLENPLRRPDLINYDQKRSVAIRTPPQRQYSSHLRSGSALGKRLDEGQTLLDHSDHTINLGPPTFENSAKRHQLEILTKVNPSDPQLGINSLDHLYQPSGYNTRSGYTIVGPRYEHGNAAFSHTGSDNRGSFNIAPDWVSEKKRSIVVRH